MSLLKSQLADLKARNATLGMDVRQQKGALPNDMEGRVIAMSAMLKRLRARVDEEQVPNCFGVIVIGDCSDRGQLL